MPASVQFINGRDGRPQFAVIPYEDYRRMAKADDAAFERVCLLSPDRTKISLPNGGPGAYLDLRMLAGHFARHALESMAINQRAQTLDKFPYDQNNTLDPIIRRYMLVSDSPYKDTMQATTEVVDALVESGLFTRSKIKLPAFYRPVNAIASVASAIREFLAEKGVPQQEIPFFP
jgi:hypothetical protein